LIRTALVVPLVADPGSTTRGGPVDGQTKRWRACPASCVPHLRCSSCSTGWRRAGCSTTLRRLLAEQARWRAISGLSLSGRFRKPTICRHEPPDHVRKKFHGIGDGLVRLLSQDFGIGDQLAVDLCRQIEGHSNRLFIFERGELELCHRLSSIRFEHEVCRTFVGAHQIVKVECEVDLPLEHGAAQNRVAGRIWPPSEGRETWARRSRWQKRSHL
jgi:hypothetical protein